MPFSAEAAAQGLELLVWVCLEPQLLLPLRPLAASYCVPTVPTIQSTPSNSLRRRYDQLFVKEEGNRDVPGQVTYPRTTDSK